MFNSLALVVSVATCLEELDLAHEPLEDCFVADPRGQEERVLAVPVLHVE